MKSGFTVLVPTVYYYDIIMVQQDRKSLTITEDAQP